MNTNQNKIKRNYKSKRGSKNASRKTNSKYNSQSTYSEDENLSSIKDIKSTTTVSTNDPRWYTNIPDLANYATRIKTGYILGVRNSFNNDHFDCDENMVGMKRLPGILAMDLLYGPGITNGIVSATTRVMDQVYTALRMAKRGTSSYLQTDLYMYLLHMADIKVLYSTAARAYGLVDGRDNSLNNMYEHKAIIEACGWDYDDLIGNAVKLHRYMNEFTKSLSEWRIPAQLDIYNRLENIFSYYYVDDQTSTAQIYTFRPYGYRVFNPYAETGSQLDFHRMPKLTVEGWRNIMQDIVSRLRSNEDVQNMNGDLMYVYKDSHPVISPIDKDYTVKCGVYDPLMLQQIRNATILDAPEWETCNIVQNPKLGHNYIVYDPIFGTGGEHHLIYSNRLYTCDGTVEDANNPYMILEATRLMNIPVPCTDGQYVNHYKLEASGTEVVVGATLYSFMPDQTDVLREDGLRYEYIIQTHVMDNFESDVSNVLTKISLLSKFNSHPSVNYTISIRGECKGIYNSDDVNTYGIITRPILNELHNVCVLSLWNCESPLLSNK